MVGPYRGLFERPGTKAFVLAGLVGRMPMSMLGIGVILLITALTDNYATAGAVGAVSNLAFAAAAPLSGRLADRFGQGRVIPRSPSSTRWHWRPSCSPPAAGCPNGRCTPRGWSSAPRRCRWAPWCGRAGR
ncbi:hypothetical protein ACFQ0B_28720 [Nonomuraea thailandensis]